MVLICFILQCSVFNHFALGGIVPNLMIVVTASFGFMRGERDGIIIGFCCGLLCDIFSGNFLGFYALILMYIGFINGKFNGVFYPEDIKLPIGLIVTSDLTYGILCYILLFLLRGKFEFTYYLSHIILPEVLYTIVVSMFIYPVILKISLFVDNGDKRRH